MADVRVDEILQLLNQRRRLLRCQIETEHLDGDQPFAARLVRAKDGTECACANLMEKLERPKRLGRKVQDGIFAVQHPNGNIPLLHLPVDIRRFPGIKKLAADYASCSSSLAPFFAGHPSSSESWTRALADTRRYPRPRTDLAAVLTRQLARRDAPAAAREAAARLAQSDTVAVVTGQQAGLFGGPLYTLFKSITAIQLAAKISREHHVPAVAVFWVESEDHDWDEVASCSVLDAELRRQVITLAAPESAGHSPVGRVQLNAEIQTAIDRLAAVLPHSEFTPELLESLSAAYRPGATMSDAFARWLDRLLGGLGLVVFDCSDSAAKPLASGIFAHEMAHPGRTWELATGAGQQLAASGYHAQVDAAAHDTAALFRLNDARAPIALADAPRLTEAARTHPETFSPNVLLRPIVEDALFPTVTYVSGPNELAYLAQLRGVYDHFGVPMPLVYPRATATVLDSASARFLAKHELPFESLQAQDESALNRVLAATLPESVDEALTAADAAISEKLAAVIAAVPAVDATLEGAARSTLGKIQHDLATLRGKVISAAKKRDETLRRQFHRAQAQAFPDGIPQERALGSIALLNRYGFALVDRLNDELPLDFGHHWVITL